ncbi:hypothetical protein [Dyadobacter sp. CY343]
MVRTTTTARSNLQAQHWKRSKV